MLRELEGSPETAACAHTLSQINRLPTTAGDKLQVVDASLYLPIKQHKMAPANRRSESELQSPDPAWTLGISDDVSVSHSVKMQTVHL